MDKVIDVIKIWLISDTHGKHEELLIPDHIDMVISAGDGGTYKNPHECKADLDRFLTWFNTLPIKHKVYIAGNHDTAMEAGLIEEEIYQEVYILKHESIEIDGVKIFGSPYTPAFFNWAYNSTEEELVELWKDIPNDLDILVTHGPPNNILDRCRDGYRAGCKNLLKRVIEVKPKYHVFGHIHEDGGKKEEHDGVIFINASILDLRYQHHNDGQIIELNQNVVTETTRIGRIDRL
jgi:Icc-related predicted phosphoesterase